MSKSVNKDYTETKNEIIKTICMEIKTVNNMMEKVCIQIKVKIDGLITSMNLDPESKYSYF